MDRSVYAFAPYCGAHPTAASLMARWNLDPVLLAALALVAAAYALSVRARPSAAPPAWRRACFWAGWALGAAALVSPLCALGVALFSARVGQHMLLVTLVAPLLALGLARARSRAELPAAAAFTVALWFWHAPGPYAATFNGPMVYWLMHLTLFGTALWLWREVLAAGPQRLAPSIAATLAVGLQMAFLGAIITFAPAPLYAPHALTTAAWGLTPLADQQLGGVIMWIPAGPIFAAAILLGVAAVLGRQPATGVAAPAA